jgi:hypothetical protein
VKLAAELGGVARELLREVPPFYTLEAGIVLDHLGVEEFASWRAALEHDGLEHRAPRIQSRCHPGRSGADDHDLVVLRPHDLLPKKGAGHPAQA